MSTPQSFDNGPDDVDLTAAEYVLGVLDADARRLARDRIARDPAFAAEIAHWESWFSPWLQSIAPVEPPASTWSRVRTALWQHELTGRDPRVAPEKRPSLWQNLAFWRGLAAGGFAVAVASVAALLLTIRQAPIAPPVVPAPVVVAPAPAPPMVVALRHDDGTTAYTATVDPARGTVVLVPVRLEGDPTLSPELWLIPAGDKPHSLGMLRRGEAMVVNIPANLRGGASTGGLLAISLEPAGSHAHEAPTGPVVAKGDVVQL